MQLPFINFIKNKVEPVLGLSSLHLQDTFQLILILLPQPPKIYF